MPPVFEGANLHPLGQAQAARPLGPHHALVAREAQHADAAAGHINGKGPRRLGGVHNIKQAMLLGKRPDSVEIHQIAGEV